MSPHGVDATADMPTGQEGMGYLPRHAATRLESRDLKPARERSRQTSRWCVETGTGEAPNATPTGSMRQLHCGNGIR